MFTLILFLSAILTTTADPNAQPYIPTVDFLVNCGSDVTTLSWDARKWDGDAQSEFLPANAESISTVSTPSSQAPSVTPAPYMTARIFQHSPFTYTFPVSAGSKFLRLYFYPATYSGLQKSYSFFSVTTGDYTLLKNFSAFFTVTDLEQDVVIKEFVIEVRENQRLNVTFSPSPNSYAFINGIEIVSIPDSYYVRGLDYPITNVGQIHPFYIENNTALESLYRLNVGGNYVPSTKDSGMFRSWVQDDKYLLGNNSLNYNMAWSFPVDSGFFYLLRLCFCEFQMEVTKINQRVFTIYINNQMAQEDSDVIKWSAGNGIPVYGDYLVFMKDLLYYRRSKHNLSLSMRPYMRTGPQYVNAILNGLEIFKLSKSDGSLAGPNPEPPTAPPVSSTTSREKGKNKDSSTIFLIIGSVLGGATVVKFWDFQFSGTGRWRNTTVHRLASQPTQLRARQGR